MSRLLAVQPISDEDVAALPVRTLERAIEFYTRVLGFTLLSHAHDSATLGRDAVRLGLVERDSHEPGRAGSVAIETDDLDGLHEELRRTGGQPGVFGIDEWDGQQHRTFFLREADDGYCYCFYRTL